MSSRRPAYRAPVACEPLEARRHLAASFSVKINFQTKTSETPAGYSADIGRAYGDRRGLTFGWSAANEGNARDRNASLSPDQRYDTFNHLLPGAWWALAVPRGTYQVRVVVGDPDSFDGRYGIVTEGVIALHGTPTSSQRWLDGTTVVNVTDGTLKVNATGGSLNNKLAFIEVTAVNPPPARPAPPTNVTAATQSASRIRLRWTDESNNETGFMVDRRVSGAWQPIALLPPGGTEYTDRRLNGGTSYLYRVRSFNAAGSSSIRATASTLPVTGSTIRWTTRASAPIIRAEALTAEIGGRLYVFGGFNGDNGPVRRSDVYNPATDSWSRIADLPTRLTHAGVAVVGRNVYVAGGYVGIGETGYNQEFGTRDVWRYNVDADEWFAAPDLPAELASGGLVALGNTLHYFGGNTNARVDTGVHYALDLSDPTPTWTSRAALPTPRSHMGYVAANNRIWAVVGQSGNDDELTTRTAVHAYNPNTDTWSAAASAPLAVSHVSSSTFVLGNRILVMGGETDHESPTSNVMAYDLASGTWSTLNPLPSARFSGVARAIDGIIYFTGGSSTTTTYRGVFA